MEFKIIERPGFEDVFYVFQGEEKVGICAEILKGKIYIDVFDGKTPIKSVRVYTKQEVIDWFKNNYKETVDKFEIKGDQHDI